jgi:hypothetical protein
LPTSEKKKQKEKERAIAGAAAEDEDEDEEEGEEEEERREKKNRNVDRNVGSGENMLLFFSSLLVMDLRKEEGKKKTNRKMESRNGAWTG